MTTAETRLDAEKQKQRLERDTIDFNKVEMSAESSK